MPEPTGTGAGPPDGLLLDSLRRRMRALFSLYDDAVATMDLEQVNHFEREGVLPIAFSLFHIVNMVDASFLLMTGTAPVWDDEWRAGPPGHPRPRQGAQRRRDGPSADRRLRAVQELHADRVRSGWRRGWRPSTPPS